MFGDQGAIFQLRGPDSRPGSHRWRVDRGERMTWQEIDLMMRSCIGDAHKAVFIAGPRLNGPRVVGRVWATKTRVQMHLFASVITQNRPIIIS